MLGDTYWRKRGRYLKVLASAMIDEDARRGDTTECEQRRTLKEQWNKKKGKLESESIEE
jgi:hypothetical protein